MLVLYHLFLQYLSIISFNKSTLFLINIFLLLRTILTQNIIFCKKFSEFNPGQEIKNQLKCRILRQNDLRRVCILHLEIFVLVDWFRETRFSPWKCWLKTWILLFIFMTFRASNFKRLMRTKGRISVIINLSDAIEPFGAELLVRLRGNKQKILTSSGKKDKLKIVTRNSTPENKKGFQEKWKLKWVKSILHLWWYRKKWNETR